MTELAIIIKDNLSLNIQNVEGFSKKIIDSFNEEEQQIFIKNFFIYQKYNPLTDYVVELGKIYEWLGFTTLGNSKRVLIKHFKQDEDYKIVFIQLDKNPLGGRPAEKILMNVNCFKNLCLIAQTEEARKIHKYYVKLENIVFHYINEELQLKELIIQNKEKENERLKNEIELSKKTKENKGFIYIAGDMKDNRRIYKVGQTIDKTKRLSSLNTSHSDNSFVFYEIYKTENRICAEQLIHTYLENQGYRYKKEFFEIELTELIEIVNLFIELVNNIFANENQHENIKKLIEKMKNNGMNKEEIKNLVKDEVNKQPKLDITINYNFYDYETYKSFINDKIEQIKDSQIMTKQLLECFENYTKEKEICAKDYIKGGGVQSYYYNNNFKEEFVKILEKELNSKQIKLKKQGDEYNKRGFRNVSIKD